MSVGSAWAADFCAGLTVLTGLCSLDVLVQAEPVSITAKEAARTSTTRWVRAGGDVCDIRPAGGFPGLNSGDTGRIPSSVVVGMWGGVSSTLPAEDEQHEQGTNQ